MSYLNEINENGYTIITVSEVISLALKLRADILRLVNFTQGAGRGKAASMLLGRNQLYAQAVLFPPLLGLAKDVLGENVLLSQVLGVVRPQGSPEVPLHADSSWFPSPLPEWDIMMTACWVLDPFTLEGGCTAVVPKSHKYKDHPGAIEKDTKIGMIPIECPTGSIVVWNGRVWHANYPRTSPGERVTLHIMYNRFGITPMEDYSNLKKYYHASDLANLLGNNSFLGSSTLSSGGVNPEQFLEAVRHANKEDTWDLT